MSRLQGRILAAVATCAVGCTGKVEGPGRGATPGVGPGTGAPADGCANATPNVPASQLQRMNGTQVLNTERTLFNQPALPLDLEPGTSPIISQLEAQKIDDAAATLVATGGHLSYVPCDPAGAGSDACAQGFIQAFGLRAFRRPVQSDEVGTLMATYQATRALTGVSPAVTFRDAIDVLAQVMVQSPQHLYLSALGVADPTLPAGLNRMTGYERATRLAYVLTDSTPDATLLQAAAAGALDAPAGLRAAAEQLLATDAGHATIRSFASAYANLNDTMTQPGLDQVTKDLTKFPYDSPALRVAMRAETEALYEHVFYDLQGDFSALMTSTDAYVNAPLATLYGVAAPNATATTFSWVSLDATQRAGLFTRAAFLAENGTADYESPIRRGVHIYRDAMCRPIAPPPPNVNNVPPGTLATDAGQELSIRQTTELQTSAPLCQGCHGQFNPVGFALNTYDAMGAWQTHETGVDATGASYTVPVDATSTVTTSDLAGPVHGPVDLSHKLAQSAEMKGCMGRQWFVYAFGRPAAAEDKCTIEGLSAAFARTGDMHQLVLDVVTSAPAQFVRQEQ